MMTRALVRAASTLGGASPLLAFAALSALASPIGCLPPPSHGGSDASVEAGATDADVDVSPDVAIDATEASADAMADAACEGGACTAAPGESPSDSGADADNDSGADADTDSGADADTDSGADAGLDASMDAADGSNCDGAIAMASFTSLTGDPNNNPDCPTIVIGSGTNGCTAMPNGECSMFVTCTGGVQMILTITSIEGATFTGTAKILAGGLTCTYSGSGTL
jgi:hypothetical protein